MESHSRKGKPSQQQIAAHLGVSQALVSMVLNGRNKGINPETYRRIWDHAVAVGYTPKGMRLQSPRSTHRRQVGFILRAGLTLYTQSNYFSHIQQGLHSYLEDRGHSSLFLGTETTISANDFRSIRQVRDQLAGIIIMGQVEIDFLKKVRALLPRLVLVSASYPGYCHSIVNNEQQAVDLLVGHLYALGHRKFAWLGGNRRLVRHEQRFNALQRALRQVGCECLPETVTVTDEADRREGRVVAARLLERFGGEQLPTAWIAYNGLMARGAANYLLPRQIRIPEEISLAAIDGTRVCEEEDPGLTGAFADPAQMGAAAGEVLLQATGCPDEVFTERMLPATLTVRASTGPAPIRKAPVAGAAPSKAVG